MDRSEDDGIPSELKERLGTFDAAVSSLESMLQPLLSTSYTDLVEKVTIFCIQLQASLTFDRKNPPI